MRYISGSWCAAATRAVAMTFVITAVAAHGGAAQRSDIRQSLGLDSAAYVDLQNQMNGRPAVRVRIGTTDWRLTRPVLDATSFTYDGRGVPSNQESLSIGDADEIWIRSHAMVPGAKYGALTLGIPSVILAVALMLPCPEDQEPLYCQASVGSAAAFVGAGVTLGAIVGGVIGLTQSRWKTVYDRSRLAPSLRACTVGTRLCVGTTLSFDFTNSTDAVTRYLDVM